MVFQPPRVFFVVFVPCVCTCSVCFDTSASSAPHRSGYYGAVSGSHRPFQRRGWPPPLLAFGKDRPRGPCPGISWRSQWVQGSDPIVFSTASCSYCYVSYFFTQILQILGLRRYISYLLVSTEPRRYEMEMKMKMSRWSFGGNCWENWYFYVSIPKKIFFYQPRLFFKSKTVLIPNRPPFRRCGWGRKQVTHEQTPDEERHFPRVFYK